MAWEQQIQQCESTDCVMEVVNDFVVQQAGRFWSRVPAASRPGIVSNAEDIQAWHHRLVQDLKRQHPASIELQELCVLFLRASVRLHQIELRAVDREGASNDEMRCAPAHRSPRRRT
jgi:hypothetical protein